ncbi:MAG: DUF2071 domain-containing protein [Mariniblastus sp.]
MATTSNQPAPPQKTPSQLKPLMRLALTEVVAVNFKISPDVLSSRVPKGLELDFFNDETYVSLICSTYRKVPFLGLPITPRFGELSLRFYVRHPADPKNRKGTCFIKNYVSSGSGARVLGSVLNSDFRKIKMKFNNTGFQGKNEIPDVEYHWKVDDHWNKLRIRARETIKNTGPETKVGFILDHSNHYQSFKGKTFVYRVQKPKWTTWDAAQANFTCDVQHLFGKEFVKSLAKRPASVFVSPGSDVNIFKPTAI